MVRNFTSTEMTGFLRGVELGEEFRSEIASTVGLYGELFGSVGVDAKAVFDLGGEVFEEIVRFAPDLSEEIRGIAVGSSLSVEGIAALNARTEILARGSSVGRGECSTVVLLGESGWSPVSIQTWDWHAEMSQSWFVWSMPQPGGGVIRTLTEYGILAKIGVNHLGLGVHLNILHHVDDGRSLGVPVHVLARSVLENANSIDDALAILERAHASASSALTIVDSKPDNAGVASVELSPKGAGVIGPNGPGSLVRTNHFLDRQLAVGDREPEVGPDSFARFKLLIDGVGVLGSRGEGELIELLTDHTGAVCCHPSPDGKFGDRYETLATVSLVPERSTLRVHPGGPCSFGGWWEP